MSDGMGRELAYLSSHATNRYFIPNWGICYSDFMFLPANITIFFEKSIYSFYRNKYF